MNASRRPLTDLLHSLPPEWPHDPLPAIAAALQARREKVVVLDDDPTGTQTVHGVPVLTQWPVEALRAELTNDLPVCFLLTNSRSMSLPAAQALNAEIGRHLQQAAELALFERNAPSLQLIIKDDKGTEDGARAAAEDAM